MRAVLEDDDSSSRTARAVKRSEEIPEPALRPRVCAHGRRKLQGTTEDGEQFVASGGDRNWRNNNPGNLKPGKVSKRNGQIGVAGGFAVFPDPETGHQALLDSLLNAHGD